MLLKYYFNSTKPIKQTLLWNGMSQEHTMCPQSLQGRLKQGQQKTPKNGNKEGLYKHKFLSITAVLVIKTIAKITPVLFCRKDYSFNIL